MAKLRVEVINTGERKAVLVARVTEGFRIYSDGEGVIYSKVLNNVMNFVRLIGNYRSKDCKLQGMMQLTNETIYQFKKNRW